MTCKICIVLLILFAGIGISAQELQNTGKISSSYDRNSLTTFYFEVDGDINTSKVRENINSLVYSDKYDNNKLGNVVVTSALNRAQLSSDASSTICNYLNKQNVGKQIINKWFNRQADGKMDMELIFERGMFNATDAAFIKARSTKLGNSMLKDYGERLIQRSYVLVLDYNNVRKSDIEDYHGWRCNVNAYLYKVDFDAQTKNKIYDCWIYDDDAPEVIAQKNADYENIAVNLNYVTNISLQISAVQANPNTTLGKFVIQKSDDVLFKEMVQKGYGESLFSLERSVEDFMVKTTIYSVRPIRAKIGKKEGLTCDSRYFAYEYIYNERTKTSIPKQRGVIRATSHIVDNRHVAKGDMSTSKFYQTAGRKLEEGFMLRQQNDLGVEFWAMGEFGGIGGANLRLDYRLGRVIGIKALYLFVDGGLDNGKYNGSIGKVEATFFRYSFGLGKGFQLMRNLELRPHIGLGFEAATGEDIKDYLGNDVDNSIIDAMYLKLGANLALNLTHWMQLTLGVDCYSFIGDAQDENDTAYGEWTNLFPNRKGLSTAVGVKVMF